MTGRFAFWLAVAAALFGACSLPAAAQDNVWTVAKSSGDAWTGSASHPASITRQARLRPGDSITTGRNGRVLLVRGQETILVSPNSAVSLPEAGRPGLSTVIQQAGTIVLDVEKRNVQHFEVETPYLAAVVKGTRFRVSIAGGRTKVDVLRGQVQVTDFRSGEYALVNPQQFARSSGGGASGLRVGGNGRLGTVLQGPAQAPRVQPLPVPPGGLKPGSGAVPLRNDRPMATAGAAGPGKPVVARRSAEGTRILAPIGELRLDIRQVTNGMARSGGSGNDKNKSWSSRLQPGNGGNDARQGNNGSAGLSGTDASPGSAASTTPAANAPAAGGIVISNAATNAAPAGGGGRSGNGGGNSGASTGGSNGQGAGGLDALVNSRGRGNAYGLVGGNGIGKALGLGKKN